MFNSSNLVDEWMLEHNATIELAVSIIEGEMKDTKKKCCSGKLATIIKKLEKEKIEY